MSAAVTRFLANVLLSTPAIALYTIVIILAFVAAFSAAFGAMFWLLWGYVAVPVFHAPELSFWQAWAAWALISLVGGAFRTAVNVAKNGDKS